MNKKIVISTVLATLFIVSAVFVVAESPVQQWYNEVNAFFAVGNPATYVSPYNAQGERTDGENPNEMQCLQEKINCETQAELELSACLATAETLYNDCLSIVDVDPNDEITIVSCLYIKGDMVNRCSDNYESDMSECGYDYMLCMGY